MAEHYRSCEAMGTRFEVFLRGRDEEHLESVAVAALEEVVRLDGALSRFDPRSEVARINRDAVDGAVLVDREIFWLLERCESARVLTDGYFDVTRRAALALDGENRLVRFLCPDTGIDMGAVGKGYALDCGREILSRFGVTSGLLQGGTSSVLAVGDEPWPIDLRDPRTPERVVGRVELSNCGFSCSAVRHADQRLSDVVNPLNGAPLIGESSCVVLAASATDAEFFSTALLAMGRERAEKYFASHAELGISAGWIEGAGGLCWF